MNIVKKVTNKLGQYTPKDKNAKDAFEYSEDGLKAEAIEKIGKKQERIPNRGFHFPLAAIFFLLIGVLSEVVDAILLIGVLNTINSTNSEWQNVIVSAIVCATCFASMAFVGYQRGNRKIKGKAGEAIGYTTWIVAGMALCAARLYVGGIDKVITGAEMDTYEWDEFRQYLVMGLLQFILYLGTGFLSRDAAEILTNSEVWELMKAKKESYEILGEIEERRKELKEGITKLQIYPSYVERLIKSKESTKKNIAQYNESTRAMIEAKLAAKVEPDLMTDMYDKATTKEGRER